MSKNIIAISKWFPIEVQEKDRLLFDACTDLRREGNNLTKRIFIFLEKIQSKSLPKMFHGVIGNEMELQDLEDMSSSLEAIVPKFNEHFQKLSIKQAVTVIQAKALMWRDILWKIKLQICYNIHYVINEVAYLFVYLGENFLKLTMRLSNSYNTLLAMDNKYSITSNASICSNTCPYLMFPMKKMSITRLLQILASNRAEICCHKLIDCLLETYKTYSDDDEEDESGSDNSSVEIYKALTRHMSPRNDNAGGKSEKNLCDTQDGGSFVNMEELLAYEEKNVEDLLDAAVKFSPQMLGNDGIKKSKSSGITKVRTKARTKVIDYYEEILWGEVGNYLEHVILWWASSPLVIRPPHSSQHLRDWIIQFIPTAEIPHVVVSALTSLSDALGVHVTTTSWDGHFRLALVASTTSGSSESGSLFCSTLQDLVMLSNQCEVTPDWIIGAPLDELPLVEQIPVLHRLDHSVHMTRLWAINESKRFVTNWNVKAFFSVINKDVVNCLSQLNYLKLRDHTIEIEKGGLGVHDEVCTLMRAKLVSEIRVNVQKLKDTSKECIDGLAQVCRTISLANLQMIFPSFSYWKQDCQDIPNSPSSYVNKYLEQILSPILLATEDPIINNMILKLMCESWLDHIYINKIKFSQYGAIQLLCDFAYITLWLNESPIISQPMKQIMSKNEILRRCEGVGRLLLRSPGEQIKMTDKNKIVNPDSSSSDTVELMPPEMYVPNQEQWLELRASKRKNFFPSSLCCGNFNAYQ